MHLSWVVPERKIFTLGKRRGIKCWSRLHEIPKAYVRCFVQPALGWWPSRVKNFPFVDVDLSPEFIADLVPDECNPSVWLRSRHDRFVLRVTKPMGEKAERAISRAGFWFNKKLGGWQVRTRKHKFKGYPKF